MPPGSTARAAASVGLDGEAREKTGDAPARSRRSAIGARHLDVIGISKSYKRLKVVDELNFRVAEGELVSLLGPSGCGKTTLLRLIAGLTEPDSGTVVIGGADVTHRPAHRRNVSVVFQNYALFPHLNVRDNVAFGLRARRVDRQKIRPMVDEALSLVRMSELADRSVAALSGGQQQRVAVARALVVEPNLLLLDEPFSALDRKLREAMQVELKSLLRQRGITAIFVTHDQEEALAVSNRIAVMNAGRIEQFAAPGEIYAAPASAFVLDFVGLSTRLNGTVVSVERQTAVVETRFGQLVAQPKAQIEPGTRVVLGVRPELMQRAPESIDRTATNSLTTRVADVMLLGSKTHVHGATEGDDRVLCELSGPVETIELGAELELSWPVADTLIYEVAV